MGRKIVNRALVVCSGAPACKKARNCVLFTGRAVLCIKLIELILVLFFCFFNLFFLIYFFVPGLHHDN